MKLVRVVVGVLSFRVLAATTAAREKQTGAQKRAGHRGSRDAAESPVVFGHFAGAERRVRKTRSRYNINDLYYIMRYCSRFLKLPRTVDPAHGAAFGYVRQQFCA